MFGLQAFDQQTFIWPLLCLVNIYLVFDWQTFIYLTDTMFGWQTFGRQTSDQETFILLKRCLVEKTFIWPTQWLVNRHLANTTLGQQKWLVNRYLANRPLADRHLFGLYNVWLIDIWLAGLWPADTYLVYMVSGWLAFCQAQCMVSRHLFRPTEI